MRAQKLVFLRLIIFTYHNLGMLHFSTTKILKGVMRFIPKKKKKKDFNHKSMNIIILIENQKLKFRTFPPNKKQINIRK